MKYKILVLGFLLAVVATVSTLYAQTEPESSTNVLVLQSTTGRKQREVYPGEKIAIRYTNDARLFQGQILEDVTDTSIVVAGQDIPFRYIKTIRKRDEEVYKAGKVLVIIGLISIVAIALLIVLMAGTLFLTSPVAYAILLVLAIILAIPASVMLPWGLITGIILMLVPNHTMAIPSRYTLQRQTRNGQRSNGRGNRRNR